MYWDFLQAWRLFLRRWAGPDRIGHDESDCKRGSACYRPLAGAALAVLGLPLLLAPVPAAAQCTTPTEVPNPLWASAPVSGDDAREEREFKYSFRGPGLLEYSTLALAQQAYLAMDAARVNNSLWQAPRLVSADPNNPVQYGIRNNQITNLSFFDIYFDTDSDANYQFNVEYRFRQRFDNRRLLNAYLAPVDPPNANTSDRLEAMSKVGRNLLEPGLTATIEHRLQDNVALKRTANQIDALLCDFKSGLLGGRTLMAPVKAVTDHLIGQHHTVNQSLSYVPKLIIITERRRVHMEIPLEVGGPPVETFIVTVDRAEAFDAEAMLQYMRGTAPEYPAAAGSFTEIEVEFERNASQSVSPAMRPAFLADQQTIMQRLRAQYAQIDASHGGNFLVLEPGARSKYKQAYEILFNRARGKTTRQSSTAFGAPSELAVDGNTNGDFAGASVTHTDIQTNPFWVVDLGEIRTISALELWNRTDCCSERLQNYYIIVSPFHIETSDLNQALATPGVSATFFSAPAGQIVRASNFGPGREVRIQLLGESILSLAEVKVFGHRPPPDPPVSNLAQGKSATQSSTAYDGVASRAVDGNTNGDYFGGESVTHTAIQSEPFWEVDLGDQFSISGFEIWNRTDCCNERLQDVYVFVSPTPFRSDSFEEVLDQPGVTVTHMTSPVGHINSAVLTTRGRYVRVQLPGTNYLHMAEVKVFGQP
jgi:hypothetical protein